MRKSELKPFNQEVHTGHFRRLTVRSAADQLMVIVGIHPQNLSQEELKRFKDDLIAYFSKGPGADAKVTSLYYLEIKKK